MSEAELPKHEKIKRFANEQESQGGFVYCFRGEVNTDRKNYVAENLSGTWYSEDIRTALRFLEERERSSGKKGKVFGVIVPKSLLITGRDEINQARRIINIVNQDILSSRFEISRAVANRLADTQAVGSVISASKEKYLGQFGI